MSPPAVEPKSLEARLEGIGPGQAQKLEGFRRAAARIGEDVILAQLQPSVAADLSLGFIEGVEQQLPRQSGEEHE